MVVSRPDDRGELEVTDELGERGQFGGAVNLSRSPRRPPRLELVLGPFFTLTVGSLALRGVTELASGQALTGAKDLFDFLLIFPTVALGLIAGYLIASRSGE